MLFGKQACHHQMVVIILYFCVVFYTQYDRFQILVVLILYLILSLLDSLFSSIALDFSYSLTTQHSNDKAVSQISSNPTLSITKKAPLSMANKNLAALTCTISYFLFLRCGQIVYCYLSIALFVEIQLHHPQNTVSKYSTSLLTCMSRLL